MPMGGRERLVAIELGVQRKSGLISAINAEIILVCAEKAWCIRRITCGD
jgi:hypothetical protein